MSAIRFILLCTLSVFFFSQLVLSRPDVAEEGSLKSVEAKVSIAFDDLKKTMGDIMQNFTQAIQSEVAKHPELTALYNNVTQDIKTRVQEVVSAVTPKPAA